MMLSVSGLAVAYGRIEAVKGIDLAVAAGELVCLIGANGAGKSTTLKALAGLLPAARGDIHFDGARINIVPAHERVARGIALVPEGRGIFSRLSVEENLLVGATVRCDKAGIRADLARGYELFPRLAERRAQAAGTLSGGEQQMLAIVRALMSRPRLLLLDEPSMGLAPIMVQRIFETIRAIARDGVTLLLVEQNARAALAVSDRGYVMEGGRVVLAEPAATLLDNPAVQRAYLGG
jgi:branched-chain amino acid transport system ATP-binding protein